MVSVSLLLGLFFMVTISSLELLCLAQMLSGFTSILSGKLLQSMSGYTTEVLTSLLCSTFSLVYVRILDASGSFHTDLVCVHGFVLLSLHQLQQRLRFLLFIQLDKDLSLMVCL